MPAATPTERFADAYTGATGWGIDPGRSQQDVRCPAHEDRAASMSVGIGQDGRVLLTCHAGCATGDILTAVGLSEADLFPPREEREDSRPRIVKSYQYTDEHGTQLYRVHRFEPKDFRQQAASGAWSTKGVRRVLYHLPEVVDAVKNGVPIWIVEGEKDADRLRSLGLVATCNPGGASKGRSKWLPEYTESLSGAADVRIVADDDGPGRTHAAYVADQLRPHVGKVSVFLPAAGKDVSDHLDAGHSLDELRPLELESETQTADKSEQESGTARGPSQASQLVTLARQRYELFMSDDGRPYGVHRGGANIALPLRGRSGLRSQLARVYTDISGGAVPSQSALADAMVVLEGIASNAEPRELHLRVARHGVDIVVDLGTPDGRCVVVSPGGWRREGRSPVLFRRSGAMKPLPDPVRNGDGLAKLQDLFNVAEEGFRLLVAALAAAFIPDLPHPIMTFRGEQGTGKSYAAKVVIGLIDPSGAPTRTAPRDLRSWAVQAFNSWGLCLDNVSFIADWLSDALCRAVTGDGIVDRALYSDDDVVVLEFRRVLAMTTIDVGAMNGDLAERALTFELSLIPDVDRRPEAELDAAYADAHPAILASLFDLLADVLDALPGVKLDRHPRMADFARILAAVDKARGWNTLDSYTKTASDTAAEALEGDQFGMAVAALVGRVGTWSGTASQLLGEITPEKPPKTWPKDATRAGGKIRRLAPLLRSVGIGVEEGRSPDRTRTRTYTLTVAPAESGRIAASAASAASDGLPDQRGRADASADAGVHGTLASVRSRDGSDAADAVSDAGRALASDTDLDADQRIRGAADAADAADAAMRPLSGQTATAGWPTDGDMPPDEHFPPDGHAQQPTGDLGYVDPRQIGPCVGGCGRRVRRYGDGARTHCLECRPAVAS